MSRNGSGIYNLPTGNPVVTGTTITSNWANTTLSDISTALTNSVASDGQTPITGNLQMGGNKITGLGTPTTTTDATTKTYVDTAITAATGTLGTMSTQNANNVAITGGTLNGVTGSNTGMTVGNVTGTVAIANGGTGLTSVGTSGYHLVSTGSALQYKKIGLGISGETWTNLTGSRVTGTTYTNSNVYPIMVSTNQGGSNSSCSAYVGAVKVAGSFSSGSAEATMSFIVPPSATYYVTGAAVANWAELY
jgi:hypothetical protein